MLLAAQPTLPKASMEPDPEGLGQADTCLDPKHLTLASNRELPMILFDQLTRFRTVGKLKWFSAIPALL
jgi:hypothetical protein